MRFVDLTDAGDAVALARRYEANGADELVFLDITATIEGRPALLELVRAVAAELTIPFAVGGGVRSVEDVRGLLRAGCDKVSINSAAVRSPHVLREAALEFGSQCIVLAIDAKRNAEREGWEVFIDGGRSPSGLDAVAWAREAAALGAGEILLTSIDRDGTKSGFELALTRAVRDAVSVPVIASGGAGELEHLAQALQAGADAVLCASIFHYGRYTVAQAKAHLAASGIPVREV